MSLFPTNLTSGTSRSSNIISMMKVQSNDPAKSEELIEGSLLNNLRIVVRRCVRFAFGPALNSWNEVVMELVKGETLQTAMPTMSRSEKREVPVQSKPSRILHHRAERVLLEISLLYYYFWVWITVLLLWKRMPCQDDSILFNLCQPLNLWRHRRNHTNLCAHSTSFHTSHQ